MATAQRHIRHLLWTMRIGSSEQFASSVRKRIREALESAQLQETATPTAPLRTDHAAWPTPQDEVELIAQLRQRLSKNPHAPVEILPAAPTNKIWMTTPEHERILNDAKLASMYTPFHDVTTHDGRGLFGDFFYFDLLQCNS